MSIQTESVVRAGTTTEWADTDASDGAAAPVLKSGEVGIDTTKGEVFVGDGTTAAPNLRRFKMARVVQVTLVAGTKTTADTSITANTVIQPVLHTLGTITAPKAVGCTARTPGTSFVITSADNTDTSIYDVIMWER
jgi:hypothetical protein